MNKINLSSKAELLEELSQVVTKSKILPIFHFTVYEFLKKKDEIITKIESKFNSSIIIRSSSFLEDNKLSSNAGKFNSVLNVNPSSKKEIVEGIEKVISSYSQKDNKRDKVFIQPMLTNVSMAGVIFSADIDTLSPYYIINYDESGSTISVTNGNGNNLKTYISFKDGGVVSNLQFKLLIDATKECEELTQNNFLDIEFAFANDELYIFQVRAIVTNGKEDLSKIDLANTFRKIHKKIKKLNTPHPDLLGERTIFGVMPDWNPAEIIGIRPQKLALSLYKEIITDETWAYQRDNYGYRNLRSHPLLVSFVGIPFIDVRISFNSFIPKNLNENTARKLVNYYLDQLAQNPVLHDKIEFNLVYSCYHFGIEDKLLELKKHNFSNSEIEEIVNSLLPLTSNIIDVENGLYKKDLAKIEILKIRFEELMISELTLIDKIYWLIKDVKRYGTLPFAGIARAGFIAMQMLQSFVEQDIITQLEYDSYLNSLNTISKQMADDTNILPQKEFINKYGHLRPGTYNILSKRYDENFSLYFSSQTNRSSSNTNNFVFSELQKEKIENLIIESGLKTSFDNLLQFIKEAIEGREYAKFVFTNHLSQILKFVEEFGARFNISRDELAHLDIHKIIDLYSSLDHQDVKEILEYDITINKKFYQYTKAVKLPSLICKPNDIYSFFVQKNEANFITRKRIEANVIAENKISSIDIKGKIVCIKSADPGYDFLFSKNIGGLITCYGGANSHMAIRCAEMGIPAAIGCGESNFKNYYNAHSINMDASNKQIHILA